MVKPVDLTGETYGQLTVTERLNGIAPAHVGGSS
jgi:hypothetical protein